MEEQNTVSLEDALSMLPKGDTVHTFLGAFIGADWNRGDVVGVLKDADKIFLSGPLAAAMGHGICVPHNNSWLFIETADDELATERGEGA